MKLADSCIFAAPPEMVWSALNDPAVLQVCLPGCKSLAMLDDRHFESTVQIRVGPVAATFKSSVELSDLDPPKGYTITGQGNAGAAGFAKLVARVQLEREAGAPAELQADQTRLSYDANVDIGGKLMSVGARLIQSAASKNLEAFFGALKTHVERDATPSADDNAAAQPLAPECQADASSPGKHAAPAASPGIVPQGSAPGKNARWPTWLVGAGSGLIGLVIGFLLGHAG